MPDFSLFALPFLTGLLLAALLPVLGAYLRLRNEWLAALSYSHVAAAGALLAGLAGLPATAGGLVLAGLAGAGKPPLARRFGGEAATALLLLAGWAATVLITANHPAAERLGHALFDGQLYFAGAGEFALAALAAAATLAILRGLSRRLLLARVYPDFFRIRGLAAWPVEAGFDLLAALALAVATMSLGVMGAFALVFIPPWLAYRRAADWRGALRLAVALGVAGYLAAFALALGLDQPFGAVLAALLALCGLLVA